MARRSKLEDMAMGVVVVGAVFVTAIVKFFERVGFVIPAVVFAVILGIIFWNKTEKQKKQKIDLDNRRNFLLEKYGDVEVVNNIINQMVWVGQTVEQLRDSLGSPEDIDQKVLKTKKKEVYKYGHRGANRYMYRVTLDNDVVVGWDEKY
jgi:hypothetical protein